MPQTAQVSDIEAMAEEVFDLSNLASTVRARAASAASELSEAEYLALDVLAREQPMTVGEIQKRIGVQPAQMSRILRALESRTRSLVECRINPQDRRCVDVTLTAAGKAAHQNYRQARLGFITQIFANLSPDDRVQFMRIMRSMRDSIVKLMQGN